jgi:hypothetical protein
MIARFAVTLHSDLQGTVLGTGGVDDGELTVGCHQQFHSTIQGFSLNFHWVVFQGLKKALGVLWF